MPEIWYIPDCDCFSEIRPGLYEAGLDETWETDEAFFKKCPICGKPAKVIDYDPELKKVIV